MTKIAAHFPCRVGSLSKTAEIEQLLVLGAHGPLSLQVLLAAAGLW